MPDYRWGIFLTPREGERAIHFGDHIGEPAWQDVPGELRGILRRLIVTQGDTEPASVEQQRGLGKTAPSLYDLRNLFQVNVEEGRHLWAMVYLLHRYFGRDGRDEAEELLRRRSGDRDRPRILGAFNEPTDDWLSFYMFTMFTDRDGKYQLWALSESGFDPLARTTKFMLTEEAHHMFVGETGLDRVVKRTSELMKADPNQDARAQGGIDLPMIQRYLNLWFSLSLDLFGGEISSNAAAAFASSVKGRYRESRYEEHSCLHAHYDMDVIENGAVVRKQVPLRMALNEVLRGDYAEDCQRAVNKWNRTLEQAGLETRLALPSRRFHRQIGEYAECHTDPDGNVIDADTWARRQAEWLPTEADKGYLQSLMQPVCEPGKIASWIAPPSKGINGQSFDFEYVRRE
jgi:benzoyl-CoA 2,3-dioxygenase component B